MEIRTLYEMAQQQDIEVFAYPLPRCGSMSIMDDKGRCIIGIDPKMQNGSAAERVHIGHELGHCVTGSFYNIYATADNRRRHENRADKWAIRKLIPVEALDDAIALGYTEVWQLAEYFGVTEDFIRKAVCCYVHGNLATELYF